MSSQELFIPATNEDIRRLADLAIRVFKETRIEAEVKFYLQIEVASLEDIKKYVDLDKMAQPVLGWADPIGQIMKFIGEQFRKFLDWVVDALRPFFDALQNSVRWMIDGLRFTIQTIANTIMSAIQNVLSTLMNIGSIIISWVQNVYNTLMSIGKTILSVLSGVLSQIGSYFAQAFSLLSALISQLGTFFSTMVSYFMQVISRVSQLFTYIGSYFSQVFAWLSRLPTMIIEGIKTFIGMIWQGIQNIWSFIQTAFNQLSAMLSGVVAFLQSLGQQIMNFFTWVTTTLTQIINRITQFFAQVPQLISNAVKGFVDTIVGWFTRLWNYMTQGFTTLGTLIQQYVVAPLTQFFNTVVGMLNQVGVALMGFVNAILKFPEWFPRWFYENIAKPIVEGFRTLADLFWSLVPDWLKVVFEKVKEFFEKAWKFLTEDLPKFFENVGKVIADFFTNPTKFIQDYVLKPIVDGLSILYGYVTSWFSKAIEFTQTLITQFVSSVANFFVGLYRGFIGIVQTFITNFLRPIGSDIVKGISTIVRGIRSPEWLESLKVNLEALSELIKYVWIGVPTMVATMAMSALVKGLAESLKEKEISLRPFGLGLSIKLNLGKVVSEIASFFKDIGKTLFDAFILSYVFWYSEPLRRVVYMYLRNYLPVEIPTLTETRDIARRYLPTREFVYVWEWARKWFELRGFHDNVIKLFLTPVFVPKIELLTVEGKVVQIPSYITIRDRFGYPRTLPLTLLYDIPTASEMCRMMVRDIFYTLDDFAKAIALRGFNRDIAYMFYLLHFRYPSPEKLWEFVCRGIAGELWFRPTQEMMNEAEEEARKLKAYYPLPPTDLNFEFKTLFYSLSRYMKWHDYARFAWLPNFTCDNWLVIDLMADIPTKIDMRWMARWGIFDYWSIKGIGLKTSIEEIVKKLLPHQGRTTAEDVITGIEKMLKQPKVAMDIRQYCRMLQARGLHPYWNPWVAIAETINALTEERTLLRTGFINLYEYGLFDMEMMHRLLAGFFTVEFNVGYFDLEAMDWRESTIEIPIMFLPAESKLLELRAVMDRAYDIWRDYLREIGLGLRWLVITPQEAIEKLRRYAKFMDEQWFASEVKALTGKDLHIKVDEKWAKVVIEAYRELADIETYIRIRYWLSRIIAWAIYRLAYGYVRREDLEKIVDTAVNYAKLTSKEREAILKIAEMLSEVARREYIPTPSMMATIVEYVPKAKQLVDKVLEARNVPKEWWDIWKEYIRIRPLASEVRRMYYRFEFLFSYGFFNLENFKVISEELMKFGYTTDELDLMKKTAEMYRMQRVWLHLIPSPTALTGYYRYSDVAKTLLDLKLGKILDIEVLKQFMPERQARELINTIKTFYEQMLVARTVYPDVRGYVYDLIRAYEYGVINDAELNAELNYLKQFGLKDINIELIKRRAKLRRRIRERFRH